MRVRKVMLVLCSLLLIFVAACSANSGNSGNGGGNNNNQPAAGGSVQPSNNANETAEPTEEANPEATSEMDFDMGGRTIKVVSWYDESIKTDSPDGIKMKENLDALMAKHNFKAEYVVVDYGEIKDKVSASLIAGEPLGDIIRLARPWMIPSLTKQDLFWPVDEYVKNGNAFVLQYTSEHSQYEGKGYGFRIGSAGASGGVFYNRTLMNQLGINPIQEFVNSDNWNWDTFTQVAKEANRDTDNDGKLDTWGLATDSFLVQALAANEAKLFADGKQSLEDPKTLETLNFISKLGTEKVARPTEGGDWTEPQQFFIQGNTLMFVGNDYEMDIFNEQMADYDIGFLPFPKGPSATGYHTHITIPNYYTIPKTVENPEQLIYLWEKIYDIESIYDYPQQANFEKWFDNEDDINNAKMAGESFKVIEQIDYYPNMKYYEFVDELRQGVSVSTVIEKYKATFQSAADEVWAK